MIEKLATAFCIILIFSLSIFLFAAHFERRRPKLSRLYLADADRECGQNLACIIIQLQACKKLRATSPQKSDAALERAIELAKVCLDHMRTRVSYEQNIRDS